MSRRDDLQALHDAVKAGDTWNERQYDMFGNGTDQVGWFQEIMLRDSLDAAHALHKAVLPDRAWGITCGGEYGSVASVSDAARDTAHREQGPTPARAWLLAILAALIAQEDAL